MRRSVGVDVAVCSRLMEIFSLSCGCLVMVRTDRAEKSSCPRRRRRPESRLANHVVRAAGAHWSEPSFTANSLNLPIFSTHLLHYHHLKQHTARIANMVAPTLRLAASSLIRSAARAPVAAAAPRVAAASSSSVLRTAAAPRAVVAPAALVARRGYASSSGLSQQEIQNRIVEILKSFEKVDPAKVSLTEWDGLSVMAGTRRGRSRQFAHAMMLRRAGPAVGRSWGRSDW